MRDVEIELRGLRVPRLGEEPRVVVRDPPIDHVGHVRPRPQEREQKKGSFDPPPLFQAFPQAVKDGILEVATISHEAVLQKSKARKGSVTKENKNAKKRETKRVEIVCERKI